MIVLSNAFLNILNLVYLITYSVIHFVICSRPVGKGKAMDLRSKKKDVDLFAAQLESEGESKSTTVCVVF